MRCGSCHEVFDGNAALVEPLTKPQPAAAKAAPPPPSAPYIPPSPEPEPASFAEPAEDVRLAELAPLPMDPLPETPSPLPEPTPFNEKMAALDTRAAEVLGNDSLDAIHTLELDTAIDAHHLDDAATAAETAADAPAEPVFSLDLPPEDELPATDELPPLDLPAAAEPEVTLSGSDTPTAAEDNFDLDLDVEPEPAPQPPAIAEPVAEPAHALAEPLEPEAPLAPEPATADEPIAQAVMEIDDAFDLQPMSDAELKAALEAELAARAHTISAPEHEPEDQDEPSPDSFGDMLADSGRREPSLSAAPDDGADSYSEHHDILPHAADAGRAAPAEAHTTEPVYDLDDPDQEALVQLSSASMAAAHADGARASAAAPQAGRKAGADTENTDARDAGRFDTAYDGADDDMAGDDEPGFVKRDRRRQQWGKAATIAMSLGSVLLVGALAAQGVTTFRNALAAALPPLKPALVSACVKLGCKVELPSQIDDLTIEQGELQTLSDTAFSFTTLLRNQSATAQAWPHIELVLDDASDKAILRRVFTPRDYLGPDVALDKGFAPHTEQSVKLYFELAQLKASGYHIAVFYP